jgi:hypothetical protein
MVCAVSALAGGFSANPLTLVSLCLIRIDRMTEPGPLPLFTAVNFVVFVWEYGTMA